MIKLQTPIFRCFIYSRYQCSLILYLFLTQNGYAQNINLDLKISNAGPVSQTVTNMGHFGVGMTPFVMDRLQHHQMSCRYPGADGNEYGAWAIWIGAKKITQENQYYVSSGGPWRDDDNATGHNQNRHELFPTTAEWDSVWVVNRGDTVDIPYWPRYIGVSDQDIVSRYNDYTVLSVPDHEPLYLDIIQVTYAWSGLEFLFHQYWIVPVRDSLTTIHVGFFGNMMIGKCPACLISDEFCTYDYENEMILIEDLSGGGDDDIDIGPIGFKAISDSTDNNTYISYSDRDGIPPASEYDRWRLMTDTGIDHSEVQSTKHGHFYYGIGPFGPISTEDTLHITFLQVHGKGRSGMYDNLEMAMILRDQDFRVPSPPPKPPLRAEVRNHQVTLDWRALEIENNPEHYQDQFRQDNDPEPFAGYRVYKSTTSKNGPWTLLAEYDRIDDQWDNDFGLSYTYTDQGLLNNLEYFYTVTSFSKPDTIFGSASKESSLDGNAIVVTPGTSAPDKVGQVAVIPNPYLGDQKYYNLNPRWEGIGSLGQWSEENRRIQFINLPNPSKIMIYTLSGIFVKKIDHDIKIVEGQIEPGIENWNLTSKANQAISSGIYLFTVKDQYNNTQVGKFVIIK